MRNTKSASNKYKLNPRLTGHQWLTKLTTDLSANTPKIKRDPSSIMSSTGGSNVGAYVHQ
jgi:hypothetical protein